jgi:hypothetical protein
LEKLKTLIEGTANLQSTPSGAISKCGGRRNDRRE